jgi:hypothetical protein
MMPRFFLIADDRLVLTLNEFQRLQRGVCKVWAGDIASPGAPQEFGPLVFTFKERP